MHSFSCFYFRTWTFTRQQRNTEDEMKLNQCNAYCVLCDVIYHSCSNQNYNGINRLISIVYHRCRTVYSIHVASFSRHIQVVVPSNEWRVDIWETGEFWLVDAVDDFFVCRCKARVFTREICVEVGDVYPWSLKVERNEFFCKVFVMTDRYYRYY